METTSTATEKQMEYLMALIEKSFSSVIAGPLDKKSADWKKIKKAVTESVISRSVDTKSASEMIEALKGGYLGFAKLIGETEWRKLVTEAREKFVVVDDVELNNGTYTPVRFVMTQDEFSAYVPSVHFKSIGSKY